MLRFTSAQQIKTIISNEIIVTIPTTLHSTVVSLDGLFPECNMVKMILYSTFHGLFRNKPRDNINTPNILTNAVDANCSILIPFVILISTIIILPQ